MIRMLVAIALVVPASLEASDTIPVQAVEFVPVRPPEWGQKAKPAPVHIPTGGSHWTHPGRIRDHLIANHGYTADQLIGLTTEQMLSLHDADHEGRRIRLSSSTTVYGSSCPGGVCPQQAPRRRGVFARLFGG